MLEQRPSLFLPYQILYVHPRALRPSVGMHPPPAMHPSCYPFWVIGTLM